MLIIYLISSPFSERDYNRYGVGKWIERGFNIKVLDFTRLLKPEYLKKIKGKNSLISVNDVLEIDSVSMMKKLLKHNNSYIFIDLIDDFSYLEFSIRSFIKNKGFLIQLNNGKLFPTLDDLSKFQKNSYLSKFKKVFADPSIINRKIYMIARQYLKIRPNCIIMTDPSFQQINNDPQKGAFIIRTNSFDYDYVLNDKTANEKLNNEAGILFLDTYAPFHPDKDYSGNKGLLTPANYYSAINKGLLSIQKKIGYDVLIAAHPRSDYSNQKIKNYSFPKIKNDTYQLIKQSGIVVSHTSLSLHWAILLFKPIILVTTDEFENGVKDHNPKILRIIADLLGKKVTNLDQISDNINWESMLYVDKIKYQKYINNFIKDPSLPEKRVWDIVIDRIENDFTNPH